MDQARRAFVALWPGPDTAVQQCLHAAAVEAGKLFGGRGIAADRLHLTLLFMGDAERERLIALSAALTDMDLPDSGIELGRVEYWRKSRVVVLVPVEGGEHYPALVARLQSVAEALALTFDRRPFRPHVTLARNVTRCADNYDVPHPIKWRAPQIAIAESVPGEGYRLLLPT